MGRWECPAGLGWLWARCVWPRYPKTAFHVWDKRRLSVAKQLKRRFWAAFACDAGDDMDARQDRCVSPKAEREWSLRGRRSSPLPTGDNQGAIAVTRRVGQNLRMVSQSAGHVS